MVESSADGGATLRLGFVSGYHWYEKQQKNPGGRLDGRPVVLKSMIDQRSRNFEHTC